MSKSSPVRGSWYRTFQTGFDRILTTVSQCADETVPDRKIESVTPLCTIEWTPDIPFSSLEWKKNSLGDKYKALDYEVEFIPLGATAEFAIYVDGRRQGANDSTVHIQYES